MTALVPAPVTLLTGFLGSGKTTVMNTLLRHPGFARTAVIVNEFGEIGLDHELVVSSTESMVLLQSGCLCCAMLGDLVATLRDLSERRDAGELDYGRVVIETSGLADPVPILHSLLTDRAVAQDFLMDGIVATVDAATGLQTLERHAEARHQVALAERVLLTKTDLPEAQEGAVRRAIAGLNPNAPIQTVTDGDVDPESLLGLGFFNQQMRSDQIADWLASQDGTAADDSHLRDIRAVSYVLDTPVTANQFDFWMDLLMARCSDDILRMKGLIHLTDIPHPFVVHGVQHIFHPPVLLRDWQGADRRSKFVMIVRGLPDAELDEIFGALRAFPAVEHRFPVGYLSAEAPG
jgi:G3E family GTPase